MFRGWGDVLLFGGVGYQDWSLCRARAISFSGRGLGFRVWGGLGFRGFRV